MHLRSVFISLALTCFTAGEMLTYDPAYDMGTTSLSAVACSNGQYGLEARGYTTFASLANFPYIGAAAAVEGWNSPQCGSCWQLTYIPVDGSKERSIYLLAIDHTADGYNTGVSAMNDLTKGHAVELGKVSIVGKRVDPSKCLL
ncbi:hypothetical protein AX17_001910 [Amanita inopinata Kibby_2008]|nr:hypothetical protein AX17_001910 [Amanita inopinata Kibby_2008]